MDSPSQHDETSTPQNDEPSQSQGDVASPQQIDEVQRRIARHRALERNFGARVAYHPYNAPSSSSNQPPLDRIINGITLSTCNICLEPLSTPCTLLPCNHIYDLWCIWPWLDQQVEAAFRQGTPANHKCPLCRQVVTGMQETIPGEGTYGSRGLWNFVITNVPQPPVYTEADFMRRQDINFDVPHFPHPLRHAHLTGDWVFRIFATGDNDVRCLDERGDIRTVRMVDLLNANTRNLERWQDRIALHVSAQDYV
jgi:hypothetical protein